MIPAPPRKIKAKKRREDCHCATNPLRIAHGAQKRPARRATGKKRRGRAFAASPLRGRGQGPVGARGRGRGFPLKSRTARKNAPRAAGGRKKRRGRAFAASPLRGRGQGPVGARGTGTGLPPKIAHSGQKRPARRATGKKRRGRAFAASPLRGAGSEFRGDHADHADGDGGFPLKSRTADKNAPRGARQEKAAGPRVRSLAASGGGIRFPWGARGSRGRGRGLPPPPARRKA